MFDFYSYLYLHLYLHFAHIPIEAPMYRLPTKRPASYQEGGFVSKPEVMHLFSQLRSPVARATASAAAATTPTTTTTTPPPPPCPPAAAAIGGAFRIDRK